MIFVPASLKYLERLWGTVETARDRERERVKELLFQEDDALKTPSGSGRNSPATDGSASRKTEAEKRFEEVQKRRVRLLLPVPHRELFF